MKEKANINRMNNLLAYFNSATKIAKHEAKKQQRKQRKKELKESEAPANQDEETVTEGKWCLIFSINKTRLCRKYFRHERLG